MGSNIQKLIAWIILIVGVLGGLASIIALKGTTRILFVVILFFAVSGCIGFLIGQHIRGSIQVFKRRPQQSLNAELSDAKEVWFAWHSGSVKIAEGDLFNRPRHIRLILTKPDSQALKEVAKISNLKTEEMSPGIQALTKKVKEEGGKVVWFDGPIGNSIIIADPDEKHGWGRIEFLIPFTDPASRPSIKVFKNKDPELFGRIRQCFEELYKHGVQQ